MKFLQPAFAIAASSVAFADFWMVYQRRFAQTGLLQDTFYGTTFVRDMHDWTCQDDAFEHRIFSDRRKISGDNYGVQFEPENSQPGPIWHYPFENITLNLDESPIGR